MDESAALKADALPFIDSAIDQNEQLRIEAMRLVDDELEIFPPDKDYLGYLPMDLKSRTFLTPLLEAEQARIENTTDFHSGGGKDSNDLAAIITNAPQQTDSDEQEFSDWLSCLNQLKVKIEYRQRQLVNLEVLKTHNTTLWEQYIERHQDIKSSFEQELNDIIKKAEATNFRRKTSQERVAKTLEVLRSEWISLANRNHALASEIERMQRL